MLGSVLLQLLIIVSFYLSSNAGITSGIEMKRGKQAAAIWSEALLKICFLGIYFSIVLLVLNRQFSLDSYFDVFAVVCIILNIILLFKNLMTRSRWYSTNLFADKDWFNTFLAEIPIYYVSVYVIVKLFFLGISY